jgi:hypothetical protein
MPREAFDGDWGRDAAINDLTEHAAAFSPPLSASLARKIAPLGNKRVQVRPSREGAGNAGRSMRPQPRMQNKKHTS